MVIAAQQHPSAGNDNLDLESQFCFALYSTTLALGKTYAPILAELRLTYPQYIVMLALWQEDGLTVRALGERLHLNSGTLTPMLKRMEQAGLVRRSRDKKDERLVRTELTPAGRDLSGRAQHIPCAIAEIIGLPMERLTQIKEELQGICRSLEAAGTTSGAAPFLP